MKKSHCVFERESDKFDENFEGIGGVRGQNSNLVEQNVRIVSKYIL